MSSIEKVAIVLPAQMVIIVKAGSYEPNGWFKEAGQGKTVIGKLHQIIIARLVRPPEKSLIVALGIVVRDL